MSEPEDDIAALQRLVYARETPEQARTEAAAALFEAQEALAERAAQLAAEQRAAEQAAEAARGESYWSRLGRLPAIQRVAVGLGVAIVVVGVVVIGVSSTGFWPSQEAGAVGAATADSSSAIAADSSASAQEASPAPDATGAPSAPDATGAPSATGAPGADSGPLIVPGTASSASVQLLAPSLSPAQIFLSAQTAADHPGSAIPGDTVESSYRLLSRGQYTPGSAFAAQTADGRDCLVVFGGSTDYGETCQNPDLAELNGLQASVTSTTILSPRSGSNMVVVARFTATWRADGTFELTVSDPAPVGGGSSGASQTPAPAGG